MTERLVNSNLISNGRQKQADWEDAVDKDVILTEIRDGYRVITLNRPDSLNSFNASVHAALDKALT